MVTISIGGNGCGSVAGLTGNSGGSMITYRYDAYGNTTKSNNTLNNPYQYNAEYTDSSTELQYLRARYYDSSQGRFTTKDTLLGSTEKPITRNLYTYCGNNPLNITDPSGHGWFKNAVNSVKRTANKVVNTVKRGYNTAKNWANTHIVQPVKSFISNTKQAASNAYNRGKSYVQQKYNQAKQSYNNAKTWVSNKWNNFKSDVSAKTQKAIDEVKRFVCTTKDRINTSWNEVKSWSQEQIDKIKKIAHDSQVTYNSPDANIESGSAYAYGYRGEAQGYYGDLQGSAYAHAAYARVDANTDFNLGIFSGNIDVDRNGKQRSGADLLPGASVSLEAKAGGVSMGGRTSYVKNDYGVTGDLNANALYANAKAEGSIGKYEDSKGNEKYGVNAELSAMASVISGDASVGFVIAGYEIDLGVRGHAVAAGGQANISIESGELDISADIAAFIGFGFDVGIKKYEPVYK